MAHARLAAVSAAFVMVLHAGSGRSEVGGAVESALGFYTETQLNAAVAAVSSQAESDSLWSGRGHKSAASFNYSAKHITFKNPGNLLVEQLGVGVTSINEQSLSLSADQGLQIGTQVGLAAGITKSPLSDARFFGAKVAQWFRSETLQTTLDLRRTDIKSPPVAYTDVDGKRIRTPADLHGLNAAVTVMHFTTPTTILRGNVSMTQRSDRPLASAESFEIRQFVPPVNGAVHAAITHYENVGEIDDTQTYGSIVANNARVEWNQRLLRRAIVMGGYRYYLENEKPRTAEAPRKSLGTDAIYGSARWRFGARLWTSDAPEAFVFASRYNTNVPTQGYVLGLGGRVIW